MSSLRKGAMTRSHKTFIAGRTTRSSSFQDTSPEVTRRAFTEPRKKTKRRYDDEQLKQKIDKQKKVINEDNSENLTETKSHERMVSFHTTFTDTEGSIQNSKPELSSTVTCRRKNKLVDSNQVKIDKGNAETVTEMKLEKSVINGTKKKVSIDYESKRNDLLCKLSECTNEELVGITVQYYDATIEYQIKYKYLKDNCNELKQFAVFTKEEWQKGRKEINELKTKLEYEQEEKLEKLASKNKELLENKTLMMEEHKVMLKKVEHLVKLNKDYEETEQNLITEKEQLSNHIAELETIRKQLEGNAEDFGNKIIDLENKNKAMVEAHKQQLREMNDKNIITMDEKVTNSDLVAENQHLTNHIAEVESIKYELEGKVHDLCNQLVELERMKCDAVEKNKENIGTVLLVRKSIEDEKLANSHLVAENKKLNDNITKVESIRDELEGKVQDLCNKIVELERVKNGVVETEQNLITEKEQLSNHIAELETIRKQLEGNAEDFGNKIIELENKNKAMVEAHKQQLREMNDKNIIMMDEKVINSDLVAENQHLTNHIAEVESIKYELEGKVHDLCNQLVELERIKSEAVEKNKENIETVLLVRKSIEDEKLANSELVAENQKLINCTSELETVKFQLEEQVKKSKDRNIALEEMNTNLVKENKQICQQIAEEKDEKVTASNILNILSPHVCKESNKYFFMNDSIVKWIKDDDIDIHKMSIYENVILDLQEVMDFYCLLTGVSVWKSKCYHLDSNELPDRDGRFTQYHCQLNLGLSNASCEGFRFIMNLDYERKEIKYSPDSSAIAMLIPKILQDPINFNADQSYMFLKGVLENV